MSEAPILVDATRVQEAGTRVARMYERHGRTVFGLCRMLLRDEHDAEDALQATFLAAHGALVRGGAPRDEGAWLATIARNECRGRMRARMRDPLAVGDEVLVAQPDPAPPLDDRIADPGVRRALAQLPTSQREAVVLHDVLGLKAREVGRALGMSVPAVEALLFRGRRQLRLRLKPAAGALVLPVAVRETLSHAIPGFATSDAAAAVATGAGVAGAGLLAKLAAAPTAAKVAAGVAAVATTGSVVAVEQQRRAEVRPAVVQEPAGTARSGDREERAEGAPRAERPDGDDHDGDDDGTGIERSDSGRGADDGRVEGRSREDDDGRGDATRRDADDRGDGRRDDSSRRAVDDDAVPEDAMREDDRSVTESKASDGSGRGPGPPDPDDDPGDSSDGDDRTGPSDVERVDDAASSGSESSGSGSSGSGDDDGGGDDAEPESDD